MAQKLIRFISTEEFRKILKEEKDNDFKLAYVLGFGSGLRISEIVGLHDFECKCGEEVERYVFNDGNKKTKGYICKKCGRRDISDLRRSKTKYLIKPLEKEQVDTATRQIKLFGKGSKERITVINPQFPIRDYMLKMLPLKINRRTLENRFRKLCENVLGKPLNFHALRHGFANHLINERNIPLPMVQGFGGWARLDTVGIYAKANPVSAVNKVWEGF